ncbi:unnamed protein product [Cylicostephanus goldi]|uniref:Uncharacterized protein n=1 Tax=Cylicostephanus goldi TaxID=71465 RepID=A0A3P7MRC1_CYLGO|nr:unnamed protein product [Cylicostephanus goldi]
MAWNESFSAADGGGWAGDASFATAPPKEAQSAKIAERLPVPVTVADLHDSANVEEKYELGDYPFSTVSSFDYQLSFFMLSVSKC